MSGEAGCRDCHKEPAIHEGLCDDCLWKHDCRATVPFGFDPNPPKKAPAIDGWVYCPTCSKPQPAAGHECRERWHTGLCSAHQDPSPTCPVCNPAVLWVQERAEFAESLLCAMAFDHGLDRMRGFVWPHWCPCAPGICVFCDAARGTT